jgi:hypothetical protein
LTNTKPTSTLRNSLKPVDVQDFDNCDVLATEFVINGKKLYVLVADAAKNLRLFAYDPKSEDSWGGKRLLPVYDPAPTSQTCNFVSERILFGSLARGNRADAIVIPDTPKH